MPHTSACDRLDYDNLVGAIVYHGGLTIDIFGSCIGEIARIFVVIAF